MIYLNHLSPLSLTIISLPFSVVLCLSFSLIFSLISHSSLSHTLFHLSLSSPSLSASLSHFLFCSLSRTGSLSLLNHRCGLLQTYKENVKDLLQNVWGETYWVNGSTLSTLNPESLNLRP